MPSSLPSDGSLAEEQQHPQKRLLSQVPHLLSDYRDLISDTRHIYLRHLHCAKPMKTDLRALVKLYELPPTPFILQFQ